MKLKLLISLFILTSCSTNSTMSEQPTFDWQGHRGCRGILPENTIPAFLHALTYPEITTLELDVVINKEGRVIVSHDPWMHPEICLDPQGEKLADTPKIAILDMRLDEIQAYDCGSLPHARFPDQHKMKVVKPTLGQVFVAVREACEGTGRELPKFNIEIKYLDEWEKAGLVPSMQDFIEAVLISLKQWPEHELINLQCFHPPVLKLLHEQAPKYTLAYLDEFPQAGVLKEKIDSLGFVPEFYSPYHIKLTKEIVDEAHDLGMKVIPWTVNALPDMRRVREAGVDGIITDYPNRIGG